MPESRKFVANMNVRQTHHQGRGLVCVTSSDLDGSIEADRGAHQFADMIDGGPLHPCLQEASKLVADLRIVEGS